MNQNNKNTGTITALNRNEVHKGYMTSLYDYWTGRPNTAIEHLTKLLVDNSDHPSILNFYRLWIEILSSQNENDALNELNRHLSERSTNEEHRLESYMALRGLIHYELDEVSAAKLMLKSLNKVSDNQYVSELQFLVDNRTTKNSSSANQLWKMREDIDDYYVLETLIKSLITSNHANKLNWVMERMSQLFPNSIMVWKYKIHKNLETQNFSSAFRLVKNLMGAFPHQIDYRVYAAFAAIKEGEVEEALMILEKAMELGYDNDLDVVYLLAIAEVELFRLTGEVEIGRQADALIDQATQLLNSLGYPTSELNILKAQINDLLDNDLMTESDEETTESVPKCWLIHLSDAHYHDLRTASDEQLRYINRPMGSDVQPGDICFFVGDDYRNSNSSEDSYWRIGAVYTVVSHPQWNPYHKFESTLKLISRPQTSIAIDVQMVDLFNSGSSYTNRYERRTNLFELDTAALESIVDAIQYYKDGLDQELNSVLDNLLYLEKTS